METAKARASSRLTHRTLILLGWSALWLGVTVQLAVSLWAGYVLQQGRCFDIEYTFAPLLLSCGERGGAELIVGWAATAVVALGPFLALVAAGRSLSLADHAARSHPALRSVWLGGTAILLPVVGWLVYWAADDPTLWGTGAWIFFTAAAMAGALVVSRFLSAVTLVLLAERREGMPAAARSE